MATSKYQGQTDTTLEITLDPYLLTVSLLLAKVAANGKVPVEVRTLNIADGADIEVKFLDGNGGAVGTVKGKVYSGIYRASYALEKANSSGFMLPVASVSDYGLELAGPAIQVLPPVKIENLKWMDEEGKTELDTVFGGQRLTLVADVTLGPREEQIDIAIQAVPDTTSAQPSDSGTHGHGKDAPPLHFPFSGRIKDKKIAELLVADWDVKARKAKLTYTISLYGVTSEASKVVVYNPAQFEYSE
jgi:hypothetical protein